MYIYIYTYIYVCIWIKKPLTKWNAHPSIHSQDSWNRHVEESYQEMIDLWNIDQASQLESSCQRRSFPRIGIY